MRANGIIEAVSPPYSSPIVLVNKKDGTFRFCVDFRRLNSVTVDSAQPQPVAHELLKAIGDARVLTSTIDLRQFYWQIPLTERAKPYTVFVTPDGGQYVFTVAAFGLENAGRKCSHFVSQEVLAGLQRKFCINFRDDICV